MVTGPHAPARKTKIIVTLGERCSSEATMAAMLDAGANVGKVALKGEENKRGEHKEMLARFARAAAAKGLPVSLMLDTLGPQART